MLFSGSLHDPYIGFFVFDTSHNSCGNISANYNTGSGNFTNLDMVTMGTACVPNDVGTHTIVAGNRGNSDPTVLNGVCGSGKTLTDCDNALSPTDPPPDNCTGAGYACVHQFYIQGVAPTSSPTSTEATSTSSWGDDCATDFVYASGTLVSQETKCRSPFKTYTAYLFDVIVVCGVGYFIYKFATATKE